MIIFRKVRYKNFIGFGNNWTEIELDRSQVTTISGKNGAGKSSGLLDPITFALFKKPFRNINLAQIVNSINKKDCVVELEFDIGSIQYKVIRGIAPIKFEVYENGVLKNPPADKKDYQKILENQILKVDYETFVQVVILGSASYVPFMELKAAPRRSVIEDILDLEVFSVMNALLKTKISDNKTALESIETDRKVVQANIKSQHTHIANAKINNEILIKEKTALINDTENKIEELQLQVKLLTRQIEDVGIPNFKEINAKLQKLSAVKSQVETLIKNYRTEISFYEKNDTCPTCQQDIDIEFKTSEITTKKAAIESKEDGLAVLIEKYDILSEEYNRCSDMEKAANGLKTSLASTKSKIASANDYIISLQNDIKKLTNLNIGNAEELIKEYQDELSVLNDRYDSVFNDRNLLGNASILLKDTGIKARIIKQFIPVLNKLINDYLLSFNFLCQFELDENFNETIKSRYRDTFSYASFSQGEKMRIDLAILFAFREVAKMRNSVSTNLMIFDEVLDGSLDGEGVESFVEIIKGLTNNSNCFIITHNARGLENIFPAIEFEKVKGFSILR